MMMDHSLRSWMIYIYMRQLFKLLLFQVSCHTELNLILPNIMSAWINQLMEILLNVVFMKEETVTILLTDISSMPLTIQFTEWVLNK